ncbi:MAG: hypothetical protein KY459_05105 [Acidobacteria bacterium]|nr:hypothetical protein [Acidobacteriota bacterium]
MPVPERAAHADGSAAPPASADREHEESVHPSLEIRTHTIRIEVLSDDGEIRLLVRPPQLEVAVDDGVEWDFRYHHGTDVIVKNVLIEFGRKKPVAKSKFSSKVPRGYRPHRHFTGQIRSSAAGSKFDYSVQVFDAGKRAVASAKGSIAVT